MTSTDLACLPFAVLPSPAGVLGVLAVPVRPRPTCSIRNAQLVVRHRPGPADHRPDPVRPRADSGRRAGWSLAPRRVRSDAAAGPFRLGGALLVRHRLHRVVLDHRRPLPPADRWPPGPAEADRPGEQSHTHAGRRARNWATSPSAAAGHRRLAQLPWNEVFQVDLTEKTLRLPRLPAAWDGLSVLHISDVHFTGTPDRDLFPPGHGSVRRLGAGPGRLHRRHGGHDTHHRWIVPLFGRLKPRCGPFAILGNHDFYFDTPDAAAATAPRRDARPGQWLDADSRCAASRWW